MCESHIQPGFVKVEFYRSHCVCLLQIQLTRHELHQPWSTWKETLMMYMGTPSHPVVPLSALRALRL